MNLPKIIRVCATVFFVLVFITGSNAAEKKGAAKGGTEMTKKNAGEGSTHLQYNDQKAELKYAFAYTLPPMQMPDEKGRLVSMSLQAVALSDKPMDKALLASKTPAEITELLDNMSIKGGAWVLTASADARGNLQMVRLGRPGNDLLLMLDTQDCKLTLGPHKTLITSGRLIVIGNKKMHDFDPANVPFIEADVTFNASMK